MAKSIDGTGKRSKREREAVWLSEADAKEFEHLKRKFGVTSRPAVLRKLIAIAKPPRKKRKK